MSLADAAGRLPFPVFACDSEKRPLVKWRDPAAQGVSSFDLPGAVMIGVPTGEPSGLCVVDVDIKNGAAGKDWLDLCQHDLPPTRTHKTRSGGLHLVFRMPEGCDIRNSAGRVAPGVDVRGNGGYVIMPPSPGYSVADDCEPAEMPTWLIRACMKPEPAPPPQRATERHERYTQAAIDGEVLAVIRAPEGTRNDTLNTAAVKLGGLVGSGQMSRTSAESELTRAALLAGLDPRETAATIRSGLDFGTTHPRELPERERPGHNGTNGTKPHVPPPQPRPDGLPLVWFDDITPQLDAQDFVQGLLIEGSAAIVYGESNAGKTFWTTDLALHVSAGMEWNGKRVEQGGVIYCVLEGGNGFRNRVAGWRETNGLCDIPFASIPASLNLLNPDADTQQLIDTIKEAAKRITVSVKLIVIDTLSRALAGGNENDSEDMGALVLNMDRIRAETGACVLFVHHSGKDQARGARGHSLLRAAVDTEIEVVASEGEEKTATTVKQRELSKGDTFGFKLTVVVLGQNRHGEDVTTCVVEPLEGAAEAITSARRGKRKMSPNAEIGLRALGIALGKGGSYLPETNEFPPKTYATSQNAWREEFYHMHGVDKDAARLAFNRAKEQLLRDEIVTQRAQWVWKVKQ